MNPPAIPLHRLAALTLDCFEQYLDKARIPGFANYSIHDLLAVRDFGLIDCKVTPRIGLEDILMGILRLRSRWTAWRGPAAKALKAKWDEHIAYGEYIQGNQHDRA